MTLRTARNGPLQGQAREVPDGMDYTYLRQRHGDSWRESYRYAVDADGLTMSVAGYETQAVGVAQVEARTTFETPCCGENVDLEQTLPAGSTVAKWAGVACPACSLTYTIELHSEGPQP